MYRTLTILLLAATPLLAEWPIQGNPPPTPVELQQKLDQAEKEFENAREIFNPWYTGPLITPSASMMPPNYGNFQPYVFVSGTYASYDQNRTAVSIPNLIQCKSSNSLQFGITDTLDISTVITGFGQWQSGHGGGGFADLPITIGFPICRQTPYRPQMKFTIQQLFPTGRYQHLNSNGLNLSATGGGAYQTTFGFAISKLLFWSTQHPTNARFFFGYTLPTKVRVEGFNSYGGGYGTDGIVHPGQSLTADLGIEYSITQSLVFACDLAYSAANATTFSGNSGTLATGAPASVGGGYSDNLSLAPAFEYSWNNNIGILGGAWFSVYGRNSSAFVQGILSISWTFAVN